MYYLEYDKNGYLLKYAETESNILYSDISIKNSDFYCIVKDNCVKRYEENGLFKTVSKYDGPVKLTQSFSEGESWVKVLNKKTIVKERFIDKEEIKSHKETNYPWTTYSEEKSSENYTKEYVVNMDEYAIPVSVISLEGHKLSHLSFKVKSSFLDKWNNIIDF
jgi:hypothetical protein